MHYAWAAPPAAKPNDEEETGVAILSVYPLSDVRRIVLPGNTTVVVADTVGFIRELPHELVAAFQSTLTEAREATLLLHVVDVADPRRDEHIDEVNRVLAEIGAADLPQILVFNKTDRIEAVPRVERDADGRVSHVWLSAIRGQGLDLLRDARVVQVMRVVSVSGIPIAARDLCVHPDDDLRTAAEALLAHKLREIPVMDANGQVVGLLDEADISRFYLDATTKSDPPG